VDRAANETLRHLPEVRVMGLGYAVPYLGPVRHAAERTLAFMPATQGVTNWPEAHHPQARDRAEHAVDRAANETLRHLPEGAGIEPPAARRENR
jgi:hypothetical protein